MKSFTRRLGACILAGSLAGPLAACDNGGDGTFRLLFGYGDSSSDNDCGFVEITVDAEAADAVFATNDGGNLDCVASAFAHQRGCDVTFEELEDERLHVTAGGCSLSSFDALFECGFREGDLSVLANHVTVSCDCEDDGCDHRPPACLGHGESLDDCEVCDNETDDDGDGDADCDDPNCSSSNKCDGTTPSSSSTSTSSTTGTDQPRNCNVTFRLLGDNTVGSLQWTTDYGAAEAGEMVGSGENVECESLVDGALAVFNDDDAAETLECALAYAEGFTAPIDVARCIYNTDFLSNNGDFNVTEVEAATPELALIEPAPTIQVNVNCRDVTTTTEEPATAPEASAMSMEDPNATTLPAP